MQEYFKNLDERGLSDAFKTEDDCLRFLAEVKWSAGYICKKCGHANYCAGKKPYSRRCTRCKTEESGTANTTFHKCKVELPIAFQIAWLVCHRPQLSLQEISETLDMRLMTIWKLRTKVKECIECGTGFLKPTESNKADN
jgi:hypothetical protein